MMKWKLITILVLTASLLVGCGASKSYVDQQISASESRTTADVAKLRDKTDANVGLLPMLINWRSYRGLPINSRRRPTWPSTWPKASKTIRHCGPE